MKKNIWLVFLVLFYLFSFSGCNNINENTTINKELNSIKSNISSISNNSDTPETELSSFSTKIYTPNDKSRQKNIKLTCSKLNDTIVKSRRNFFILQYCSEKQLQKKGMKKQIFLIVMEILQKDMVVETVKLVALFIMLYLSFQILIL